MRKNIASENTKNLLAKTLREMLNEKPFTKITITELVQRTGINRKTFYYHFRSTEALLAWMIEKDTMEIVAQLDIIANPEKGIDFVMEYLEENRTMLKAINGSIGRGAVHKFLYRDLSPLVKMALTEASQGHLKEDAGLKEFATEFYTEAVVGVLQNWLESPAPRSRAEISRYVMIMVEELEQLRVGA